MRDNINKPVEHLAERGGIGFVAVLSLRRPLFCASYIFTDSTWPRQLSSWVCCLGYEMIFRFTATSTS